VRLNLPESQCARQDSRLLSSGVPHLAGVSLSTSTQREQAKQDTKLEAPLAMPPLTSNSLTLPPVLAPELACGVPVDHKHMVESLHHELMKLSEASRLSRSKTFALL
jgi:hypothetical protein